MPADPQQVLREIRQALCDHDESLTDEALRSFSMQGRANAAAHSAGVFVERARAALAAHQQEESYRCPQGHTAKLTEVGSYQECPCGRPWGSHEVVAADPHKQGPAPRGAWDRADTPGKPLAHKQEPEPCRACAGDGMVREPEGNVRCKACHGSGVQPSGEPAPLTPEEATIAGSWGDALRERRHDDLWTDSDTAVLSKLRALASTAGQETNG